MLSKTEREALVVKLYQEQKMSALDIYKQTGISHSFTYRALRAVGISPAALRDSGERPGNYGGSRRFTPDIEQQIAEEYKAGGALLALAAKYATCLPTIRRCLRRQGITTRSRGAQRKTVAPEIADAILGDWHNGMSTTAIGTKYGMSPPRVKTTLRQFKVTAGTRWLAGESHGSWKSGRIHMNGYAYIKMTPGHPFYAAMARSAGYVSEHRLLMAESLGRPLLDHETVHHINGDKVDNRLENLQLRQGKHGTGAVYHCADCGSTNIIASAIAEPMD